MRSIEDRPHFLAERFEKAMHGMGTNDQMLIRLTVRCREPSLMNAIKTNYAKLYEKQLSLRIKGETSGSFEKLLLSIVDSSVGAATNQANGKTF